MAFKTDIQAPRELAGWFRPDDRVLACLPCRVRVDGPHLTHGWTVVVKRKDVSESDAAVFILVHRSPPSASCDLRLVHVLPITPSLGLALNQTPPSPSVSHFQISARPHITLALWTSAIRVDIRVSANDTPRTQALVSEIKRLKVLSKTQTSYPLQPHWLGHYVCEGPSDLLDDDQPPSSSSTSTSTASTTGSTSGLGSPISLAVSTPMTALSLMSPANPAHDAMDSAAEHDLNPLDPSFSRVAWLRRNVFESEQEWSSRQPIKIRAATYNVNDRLPPKDTVELAQMVGEGEEDVLVFGFQEVDLRSHALLISQGGSRAEDWKSAILRGLGDKAVDYVCIATSQYVGVLMVVFVKITLRDAVSEIETSERGIGLLGFGGNKAGVAVRLKIHDTTVCFVNSHLAAFADALDRRRADYQALKSGLTFTTKVGSEDALAVEDFSPEEPGRITGVEDSHILFWMGDLNYRVDAGDDAIKRWVKAAEWGWILENEQLKAELRSGKSFEGYEEGEVGFPPTYKYIHGSSTLDDRRAPAYTDRILYKIPSSSIPTQAGPSSDSGRRSSYSVKCERYSSHEVLWSDHRPVSGTYSTVVRVVDEIKRKHAVSEARRKLERLEEMWRPALEIQRTEIEFGEVKYRRQEVQDIVLRNIGRVPASFSFREPGVGKAVCKPHFWILPSAASVDPGQSLTLRIISFVDENHARDLSAGSDMNDVLVLQVENGKDTFITLSATFAPTIVGLPLEVIPKLSSFIRSVPISERKSLAPARPRKVLDGTPSTPSKGNQRDDEAALASVGSKPAREVWRSLEYLMEHGSGVSHLWLPDGTAQGDTNVLDVIEAIDTGADIPTSPSSAQSVSLALLHILQSLPEPVVPRQWHPFCLAAQTRDEAFACLEGVPGVHTNVLIGLMSVVRLCSCESGVAVGASEDQQGDQAEGASEELVEILAGTIFGLRAGDPSVIGKSAMGNEGGRERFVRLLLEGSGPCRYYI